MWKGVCYISDKCEQLRKKCKEKLSRKTENMNLGIISSTDKMNCLFYNEGIYSY